MVQETLRLIIFRHSFQLNSAALTTLTPTEEDSPDNNNQVANNHAYKTGSNSNNNTNQDGDENVKNNASKKAGNGTVSTIMSVRTRSFMTIRSNA